MRNFKTNLLFIISLIFGLVVYSQNQYPKLTEIVTDQAEIFNQEELIQLRKKLKDYEEKTSTQVVVLTIADLNGEDIEGYANKVFNQNKLGQVKKDNGVLIVFSDFDREVRIEVGYGLEHALTDLLCHRIIYHTMIPEFKKKQYVKGIDLATTQIIDFLDDPAKADQFIKDTEENKNVPLVVKILIGLFLSVFIGLFGYVGVLFTKQGYKNIIEIFKGLLTGKIGLLKTLFIIPFSILGMLPSTISLLVPVVIIYFSLSYLVKKNPLNPDPFKFIENFNVSMVLILTSIILLLIPLLIAIYKIYIKKEKFSFSLNKTDKVYFKKNISTGSNSGSSSSRSSSSGSSFSGGGGSSGGGGASGSW